MYQISGESSRPLRPPTVPTPGSAISPCARAVEAEQRQPALHVHEVLRDDAAADDGDAFDRLLAARGRSVFQADGAGCRRSTAITLRFGASLSVRRYSTGSRVPDRRVLRIVGLDERLHRRASMFGVIGSPRSA